MIATLAYAFYTPKRNNYYGTEVVKKLNLAEPVRVPCSEDRIHLDNKYFLV